MGAMGTDGGTLIMGAQAGRNSVTAHSGSVVMLEGWWGNVSPWVVNIAITAVRGADSAL